MLRERKSQPRGPQAGSLSHATSSEQQNPGDGNRWVVAGGGVAGEAVLVLSQGAHAGVSRAGPGRGREGGSSKPQQSVHTRRSNVGTQVTPGRLGAGYRESLCSAFSTSWDSIITSK